MSESTTYAVPPGDSCESCGKVPVAGDRLYVVPIGGGWAFWCAEHVEEGRNPVESIGEYATAVVRGCGVTRHRWCECVDPTCGHETRERAMVGDESPTGCRNASHREALCGPCAAHAARVPISAPGSTLDDLHNDHAVLDDLLTLLSWAANPARLDGSGVDEDWTERLVNVTTADAEKWLRARLAETANSIDAREDAGPPETHVAVPRDLWDEVLAALDGALEGLGGKVYDDNDRALNLARDHVTAWEEEQSV